MTLNSLICPDLGRWRAWLDHEVGTARLDSHLDGCPACQRAVAELRQDADTAAARIGILAHPLVTDADRDRVREQLRWRQRAPAARASAPLLHAGVRARIALGGVAAAVLVSVVVALTPEGRTAAAAFLAQFRSRQVVAVEVSPASQADISRTMNALGHLGTVQGPRGGSLAPGSAQATVTVAEASRLVGFPVQTPDAGTLPAGFDRTPRVQTMPANEIRFTFDKIKAQRYLQANGQTQINLPDKFNGASLVVSTPAAAVLEYSTQDSHQTLIIVQAGELVVDVQGGVTLEEMRDFLLGLPGLPAETVQQLRLIRNWNETLPIPVQRDKINWQQATFKGNSQGLLLNDNTGIGSAAIWQSNGHLYGLVGSLKANDLKRVADSLAVR